MKGSGGDVGTIKLDGFATLYMDKLEALKGLYRGVEHEDEMVGYLPHCTFNLNPRAASIDTPLHAYRAVHARRSHASRRGDRHRRLEELPRADRGDLRRRDRLAALEAAGLRARPVAGEIRAREPGGEGLVLESHGLFTWGDDGKDCYETTLDDHQPGDRLVRAARPPASRPSAAQARRRCRPGARRAIAARLMPAIRGLIGERRAQGRAFRRPAGGARIRRLEATCERSRRSAHRCPDHFLRTKIRPLVVEFDPASPISTRRSPGLTAAIERIPRRLRRLLRALQARRQPGDARSRTRSSISCPASA